MTLTAGSPIFDFDAVVTLEATGASVAAGNMSAAASTEATATNHQNAILVEFAAELDFGANTPTEGAEVQLHIKRNTLDDVAGNDAVVPTSSHAGEPVYFASLKAQSGVQRVSFGRRPLPCQEFDCYLFNDDDADAFTWKLYMRPVSTTTV